MDLILHFGAHRCATSSFQEYMSINSVALKRQGIGYWGPERTREIGLNWLVSGADGLSRLLHQPNTNLGGALHAEIRMDERNSK